MAERRMFAKSVINSARFLTMPPSSRLLYYDLGMAADDDGVVEAFTVMRTTGAADDDLRVLVSKGWRLLVARSKRSKPTDSRRIAQRLARLQMQSCVITFSTALEKSRTRNNVLTNLMTRLRAREVERAICSDPSQKPAARA